MERLNRRNLFGSLEAQYEFFDSLTLTEKWNTDCVVTTELCCRNKPFKYLKILMSGSVSPRSGDKVGTIEAEWANKFLNLNSKFELGRKFSLFTASGVFKLTGVFLGMLTKFDGTTSKLNDINFSAGFTRDDFTVHGTFNNGTECGGSIFHRVSPRVDAGVHFLYSIFKKSDILFGVGGRYQLDDNICLRGKINNLSQLGLGYEHRFKDCITLTFSVLFDIRDFEEGKYKLGLAVQFEP